MTQEKNEKIIEIEKEQRDLLRKYIEKKLKKYIIGFIFFIISFCYFYLIPMDQENYRPIWILLITIFGLTLFYIYFVEEYTFMSSFFLMEKKYYIWKYMEQNLPEKQKASIDFQRSLDLFQTNLLSNVTGFKHYDILFRRDIFNFRITKVKTEINIFFNLMIDFILGGEFITKFDTEIVVSKDAEYYFEIFLDEFKKVFIKNIGSLNLVALDIFIVGFNDSLKEKYDISYGKIEKEVNEYYSKHEKLIEQRAERRFELIKTIIGTIIAIIIGIIIFYLIQIFLLGSK